MSSVATDTGPLAATTPPPAAALVGTAQDVAAWLAYVGLEGRYAHTGIGLASRWWRHAGGRWSPCHAALVVAAARYALEDGYHRLPLEETATAHRLDRLLNREWIEHSLWCGFVSVTHVDRARLGLR